jgi:hypothetical protein
MPNEIRRTHPFIVRRNAIVLRLALHASPGSGFDVPGYGIHHLALRPHDRPGGGAR